MLNKLLKFFLSKLCLHESEVFSKCDLSIPANPFEDSHIHIMYMVTSVYIRSTKRSGYTAAYFVS